MRAILLLCLLLIANACVAEIHQWRDKDGNVHFGDRPPDGIATQTVTVRRITYITPEIVTLEEALYKEGRVIDLVPGLQEDKALFRDQQHPVRRVRHRE